MNKLLLVIALLLVSTNAQAARRTTVITADGTYCHQAQSTPEPWSQGYMNVFVDGDFGGGTITWNKYNGSGYQLEKDKTGSTITSAADDTFKWEFGFSSSNPEKICAVLSGATNPNILFGVYDNN